MRIKIAKQRSLLWWSGDIEEYPQQSDDGDRDRRKDDGRAFHSNENKLSHRWRERALLRDLMLKSSEN